MLPTKKLENIADFIGGLWTGKKEPFKTVKVLRNTNFRNSGHLDYSNVAEIKAEERQLKTRLLKTGDIILEKSGGGPEQPVGRVVYFDKNSEYSFSNFTCCLRIKNNKEVYSKYLWFFLYSQYLSGTTEEMQKQTTGIRNLMMPEYKKIEIPLPTIGEQRKIVEKIEKLFAKIDEAQKLREESKKSASALLQSALNEIFSGPKFPPSLKLRRASKNWEEKYFGDIVKIDTARNAKFLPYIGMEDIESGNGNFIGSHESRKVRSTTFYFNKHHVLYGKLRPYLNKFFLPDFEGHCTTEFLPLLPDKKFLIREWLAFWLRNENTVSEIMKTTTGSRMPRANMHQVRKFKIPLPPLAEQKKIVAYLDSLSEKVRELQKFQNETEKDLADLKQSILQKSFSGKL